MHHLVVERSHVGTTVVHKRSVTQSINQSNFSDAVRSFVAQWFNCISKQTVVFGLFLTWTERGEEQFIIDYLIKFDWLSKGRFTESINQSNSTYSARTLPYSLVAYCSNAHYNGQDLFYKRVLGTVPRWRLYVWSVLFWLCAELVLCRACSQR